MPPKYTRTPGRNPLPRDVTELPPSAEPAAGTMAVTVGAGA